MACVKTIDYEEVVVYWERYFKESITSHSLTEKRLGHKTVPWLLEAVPEVQVLR